MDFDSTKSHQQNLDLWKAELQALDPECTKILFDALPLLLRDEDDPKSRSARTAFNTKVLADLLALPSSDEGGQ